MASAIDPTLGGTLSPAGSAVSKSELVTALTTAASEITKLQPQENLITANYVPVAADYGGLVQKRVTAGGATTWTINNVGVVGSFMIYNAGGTISFSQGTGITSLLGDNQLTTQKLALVSSWNGGAIVYIAAMP